MIKDGKKIIENPTLSEISRLLVGENNVEEDGSIPVSTFIHAIDISDSEFEKRIVYSFLVDGEDTTAIDEINEQMDLSEVQKLETEGIIPFNEENANLFLKNGMYGLEEKLTTNK